MSETGSDNFTQLDLIHLRTASLERIEELRKAYMPTRTARRSVEREIASLEARVAEINKTLEQS